MAEPIKIPIDCLILDLKNPRQTTQHSEDHSINDLYTYSKLLAIIKSILEDGFHPVNLPLVKRKEGDRYTVRDGNRRVAALKVIKRPKIIRSERSREEIEQLVAQSSFDMPRSISCHISNDENEIIKIISLHHASGQDGKGVLPWNPIMKARAEFSAGKENANTFSLRIIDDLLEKRKISEEDHRKFPISTLLRIVGSSSFKHSFDINPSNGTMAYVNLKHDKKEQLKKLVVHLLENKENITSRELNTADQINQFLGKFTTRQNEPMPKKENAQSHMITPPVSSRKKIQKKKFLFGAKNGCRPCRLNEEEFSKVEEILDELQELELPKFSLATASLFRVYLDILTSVIDIKAVKEAAPIGTGRTQPLKSRLLWLLHHVQNTKMFDNSVLSKDKAQAIKMELNRKNGICSVSTLQAALHNPHLHLDADSLQVQWANLYPLLNFVHYHVNQQGKLVFAK